MNLRHLRTIIAVADQPTFLAAAEALGLSHSAVSLHVKALEEELRGTLVDRGCRPPALTDHGSALVEQARRMMELLDEMRALGSDEQLVGSLGVGVVPSAMVTLLPPALAALRGQHPDLRIRIRTGLSSELAQLVRNHEIDVALTTAPAMPLEGLAAATVAAEPLFVIAPADAEGEDDEALLAAHPFIWFSRKTWAGQQIERHLIERRLVVREAMEVDALEAIEALVRHGHGVSILPRRGGAEAFAAGLKTAPFGAPQATRSLVVLERCGNPKARLAAALAHQLRAVASPAIPATSHQCDPAVD
jgi:DNA-binding transcriptional LysR family regulator